VRTDRAARINAPGTPQYPGQCTRVSTPRCQPDWQHPENRTFVPLVQEGPVERLRGRVLEPSYTKARYLNPMRCRHMQPNCLCPPALSIVPYFAAPDGQSISFNARCAKPHPAGPGKCSLQWNVGASHEQFASKSCVISARNCRFREPLWRIAVPEALTGSSVDYAALVSMIRQLSAQISHCPPILTAPIAEAAQQSGRSPAKWRPPKVVDAARRDRSCYATCRG
jgi:hypothetical protein